MKFCRGHIYFCVAAAATLSLSQSLIAQVVVTDSSVNVDGLYSNWSTDGKASLTSPAASSYNNYRKGGSGEDPVAVDGGDGVLGIWTNVNHAPTITPCCGNPGMFFGNTPSPKSYADAVLNVGTYREAGNSNQGDSEGRRRYDMRVGFIESPADYVANFQSGTGHYDLWTGDWGTDGIQFNITIGGTDDVVGGGGSNGAHMWDANDFGNMVEPTNRFVGLSAALRAHAGSDTGIADERDRDRYVNETNSTGLADRPLVRDVSQPELDDILEIFGTGAGNLDARFDTGNALTENVPVEWGMELNDPGNADPALARQVKFSLQAGNVIFSQVFDPGDASNPVIPNGATGVAFDDGFFDWENSYPVIYMGPGGEAGVDLTGEYTMGFTNPNPSTLACDLDGDADCDSDDLVILYAGGTDADGVGTWLNQASGSDNPAKADAGHTYVVGDVNLDGQVDSTDLGQLLNNFGSDDNSAGYAGGDVNADMNVNSSDLGLLLNNFGASSASSTAAVPEPASQSMMVVLAGGLLLIMRRKR